MTTILIIDDDTATGKMLSDYLSPTYRVILADNGVQGIEMTEAYHPDLIICDLYMPEMDGFSVLRHLQNSDDMVNVPFIFLSGDNTDEIVRQSMTLGADGFLSKPFNGEDLLRIVKTRLYQVERRRALVRKAIDELRLSITQSLPHELRTAIMIIEGYARIVLEDVDQTDPTQKEMLQAIYKGAGRLHNMAEKYLWYLKAHVLDNSNRSITIQNTDQIIEYVAINVAQQFDRTSDLNLNIAPGTIRIDEEHLKKMVEEIIENAFKFSKSGTPVFVSSTINQREYIITIRDYGHGIRADQVQQIGGFMQFDRDKYQQPGTGLGLIIAKRLAELNGGHLTIDSRDGETAVTITLPLLTTVWNIPAERNREGC